MVYKCRIQQIQGIVCNAVIFYPAPLHVFVQQSFGEVYLQLAGFHVNE